MKGRSQQDPLGNKGCCNIGTQTLHMLGIENIHTIGNTIIAYMSITKFITFSPDVVLLVVVGSVVPDPEQASWPLRDKLTMLG